jgi:hypothetical protein
MSSYKWSGRPNNFPHRVVEDLRNTAKNEGKSAYQGSICTKNPEHGNLRYAANGNCIGCGRENARKRYHGREQYARDKAELAAAIAAVDARKASNR